MATFKLQCSLDFSMCCKMQEVLTLPVNAKRLQESVKELKEGLKGREWQDLAGAWKGLLAADTCQDSTIVNDFFGVWADKDVTLAYIDKKAGEFL